MLSLGVVICDEPRRPLLLSPPPPFQKQRSLPQSGHLFSRLSAKLFDVGLEVQPTEKSDPQHLHLILRRQCLPQKSRHKTGLHLETTSSLLIVWCGANLTCHVLPQIIKRLTVGPFLFLGNEAMD